MKRKCRGCGKVKDTGEFPIHKGAKDNRGSLCKACGSGRARGRYNIRKMNGLCTSCGEPTLEGISVCVKHWFQKKAKGTGYVGRDLEEAWIEQNGVCPYTGEEIEPPSMDLDLTDGPTWVSPWVAQAKAGYDHKTFVALCSKVVARTLNE